MKEMKHKGYIITLSEKKPYFTWRVVIDGVPYGAQLDISPYTWEKREEQWPVFERQVKGIVDRLVQELHESC